MKKLSLAVMVVISAVLCAGASIWEGAAAVSISGELPEGGYYVATKSFPRNTVVDIINLETGRSVRAIVATGLDSPGLLAILSREAADLIGIQTRSIGRIRMTMPSDPVAFSRFTEGFNPNGDPDYDPQAVVAAAAARQSPQTPEQPLIPPESAPGSMPPVWEDPDRPFLAAEQPAESPVIPAPPERESVIPVSEPDAEENVLWPWELPPASAATAPVLAEQPEDPSRYSPPASAYQPPAVSREDSTITPERGPERYQDQTRQDSASRDTVTLVPAAERPPEPYSELPLNAEITPITSPALTSIETAPVQTADRDEIPESLIIAGIPAERPGTPVQTPAEEPVRNEAASFDREEPVSPGTAPVLFSAAVINTLEKGKYYLQLGAFSKPDLVESELSRIGNTYPLAVQAGGSPEKPLYRILVGPVNLGESNALLQRFKGNGYQDAFVRKDG